MNRQKDFPDGDIAPEDGLQNDTTSFIDDARDSSDDFDYMQGNVQEETVWGRSASREYLNFDPGVYNYVFQLLISCLISQSYNAKHGFDVFSTSI
ncbi:hypothetical protein MIR68_001641 [Amoeboaphelidium protococcarum]|nr:hypothetical protein MIR68_001641 [Amoeboaphelidium protococcarum]